MRTVRDFRGNRRTCLVVAASTAMLLLAGCNVAGRPIGYAPSLDAPGDMPVLRNVADPNAPFMLRASAPHLSKRQPILDPAAVPICSAQQLSLFETRSRIRGEHHSLQLTLENQGDGCRLSGFPAITMLTADGNVLEGLTIRKVSAETISASLGLAPAVTTVADADTDSDTNTEAPSPTVLLAAHSDAAFEVAWTSGPDCTTVTRIAVSAPGSSTSTFIPRQLQLCGDSVLISAVAPDGMD